ncbi:hypothetical protein BpHYR1_031289 [Brachionus plicatilis]|uniref:Uncharacterized protein n=1 Tax=Brachionus plicatilis TaxID=10195 RepID=A0A3M7RQ57_BRAPC|nr:hypothetical protein BpHYR1_031289 [Brachionus plicatilis]
MDVNKTWLSSESRMACYLSPAHLSFSFQEQKGVSVRIRIRVTTWQGQRKLCRSFKYCIGDVNENFDFLLFIPKVKARNDFDGHDYQY